MPTAAAPAATPAAAEAAEEVRSVSLASKLSR